MLSRSLVLLVSHGVLPLPGSTEVYCSVLGSSLSLSLPNPSLSLPPSLPLSLCFVVNPLPRQKGSAVLWLFPFCTVSPSLVLCSLSLFSLYISDSTVLFVTPRLRLPLRHAEWTSLQILSSNHNTVVLAQLIKCTNI